MPVELTIYSQKPIFPVTASHRFLLLCGTHNTCYLLNTLSNERGTRMNTMNKLKLSGLAGALLVALFSAQAHAAKAGLRG